MCLVRHTDLFSSLYRLDSPIWSIPYRVWGVGREQHPITQAVPAHSAHMLLVPSQEHHYTFHPFWRLFRGPIIDQSLTRNLLVSHLVFYAWVWFCKKVVRNRDFPVALNPNRKLSPHWDREGFSGVSFGLWLTDMFIDLWACPSQCWESLETWRCFFFRLFPIIFTYNSFKTTAESYICLFP